jgi:predicted nucleic acid-binding protein
MNLYDTDIVVDVWRKEPAALAWFDGLEGNDHCITGFTTFELYKGARDGDDQRQLEGLLRRFSMIWPGGTNLRDALSTYGRVHLGNAIDMVDCINGHTALAAGVPLNGFNRKHLRMILGLKLVQPYER